MKFKCIVLRVWVCIRKWEGMGMSMGGHRNWQLSRCGENRDAQKRLATKNTVTSWTTDKHFLQEGRSTNFRFSTFFIKLSFNSSVGVARTANHHTIRIKFQIIRRTHNRFPVQPLLNWKETKLSLFQHTRWQDAKMPRWNNAPRHVRGEKFPISFSRAEQERSCQFLWNCNAGWKGYFLSSSVHLGSPQKKL